MDGLSCGALPLFKSVYIVPIGLWIGLNALLAALRDRKFKPFIASAVALMIAVALAPMSVRGGHTFALSLNPFSHGSVWKDDFIYQGLFDFGSLWLVSGVIIALFIGKYDFAAIKRSVGISTFFIALVLLFIPVFVFVTYTDATGRIIELSDAKQWFSPLPWIISLALVAALIEFWHLQEQSRRNLIMVIIAFSSVLPIMARLHDNFVLLTNPSSWHEFADNRVIAGALTAIPVEGSMIALNDLHHPAKPKKHDWRQFQIAALYGHQAFGAGMLYDLPPDADQRARRQEELAGGTWTPPHTEYACEKGWGHMSCCRPEPDLQPTYPVN